MAGRFHLEQLSQMLIGNTELDEHPMDSARSTYHIAGGVTDLQSIRGHSGRRLAI